MAVFGAVSEILVGEWYSPALAIALVIILIILMMWIFGMDSKSSTLVKWVGGVGAVAYLGLGVVNKKTKSISTAQMLSNMVTST